MKYTFITRILFVVVFAISGNTYGQKDWEAMEPYLGFWISDTKKDQNEKEYYFTYDLRYYDDNKKIVKMVINQEFLDGESLMLWEGFKGWDPVKEQVYYYGFSPQGRVGLGKGYSKENSFFWEYYGFTRDGRKIEILDEFTDVKDKKFTSLTKIRLEGQDWRQVNKDTWELKGKS